MTEESTSLVNKHTKRLYSYWVYSEGNSQYQDSIWQIVPITKEPDKTTDEDDDDIHMKLIYVQTLQDEDNIGEVCSYMSYSLMEDYWSPILKEDIPIWIMARLP